MICTSKLLLKFSNLNVLFTNLQDVSLQQNFHGLKWSSGYETPKYKSYDMILIMLYVIIGSQKLTDSNGIRDIVKLNENFEDIVCHIINISHNA